MLWENFSSYLFFLYIDLYVCLHIYECSSVLVLFWLLKFLFVWFLFIRVFSLIVWFCCCCLFFLRPSFKNCKSAKQKMSKTDWRASPLWLVLNLDTRKLSLFISEPGQHRRERLSRIRSWKDAEGWWRGRAGKRSLRAWYLPCGLFLHLSPTSRV